MPPGHYLFVFLCLFAASLARKSQNEWENNDWTVSNTMSEENGEQHDAVRYSDTIDIDGDNQGWSIESHMADSSDWPGSGAGHVNDDWGSGMSDDEDDSIDGDFPYSGYGKPKGPGVPTKRPKPGQNAPDKNIVPHPDQPTDSDPNKDIDYDPPKEETKPDFEILPEGGDTDEDDFKDKNSKDDDRDKENEHLKHSPIISTPGLLPGIIGGAVVGLLCAVLLVMFIVYRMRKKDEGSYALEEPKMTSPSRGYTRAPTKEYWA